MAEQRPEECDVQLEPVSHAHACASDCDVRPVAITRHLSKGPDHISAWCRQPLGRFKGELHELTSTPKDCTCRSCLADRLFEIKRQARLRGEAIPGEELDYDEGPDRRSRKPKTPCNALPGSAEKIAVMCERVARGESATCAEDAGSDLLVAALRAKRDRNGATEVTGVLPLQGESAVANLRAVLLALLVAETQQSLRDVFSAEGFLGRLERQLGEPLGTAARSLASWPWGYGEGAVERWQAAKGRTPKVYRKSRG